jgi:hypothetical protein
MKKFNNIKKTSVLRILTLTIYFVLVIAFSISCSGTETTTSSSTKVHTDSEYLDHPSHTGDSRVEVTKTEKVIEEDEGKGIFGILGDIIALPFRAIASVL